MTTATSDTAFTAVLAKRARTALRNDAIKSRAEADYAAVFAEYGVGRSRSRTEASRILVELAASDISGVGALVRWIQSIDVDGRPLSQVLASKVLVIETTIVDESTRPVETEVAFLGHILRTVILGQIDVPEVAVGQTVDDMLDPFSAAGFTFSHLEALHDPVAGKNRRSVCVFNRD